MELGEKIKARRKQLKLSQEYVADQIGISRQAVAKWESGKSDPAAANLAELAAILETTVSELVGCEEEAGRQRTQEEKERERRKNAKMLFGRWGALALINAGWDGYSSGLYIHMPLYWLALLGIGLVLLFITSVDMNKRHTMEKLQAVIGGILIFSIFFLPRLIPGGNVGV